LDPVGIPFGDVITLDWVGMLGDSKSYEAQKKVELKVPDSGFEW
jgi:hypothetical protein